MERKIKLVNNRLPNIFKILLKTEDWNFVSNRNILERFFREIVEFKKRIVRRKIVEQIFIAIVINFKSQNKRNVSKKKKKKRFFYLRNFFTFQWTESTISIPKNKIQIKHNLQRVYLRKLHFSCSKKNHLLINQKAKIKEKKKKKRRSRVLNKKKFFNRRANRINNSLTRKWKQITG